MKKIVVIAHDKHKPDMCAFLNDRAPWFYGRNIIATGRTAEYLEKHNCKIPVIHVQKGKDGGYNEISKFLKRGTSVISIFSETHQ